MCGRGAQRDLAGVRGRLALDADGRIGAGDDQLTVDTADEEEVERSRVDADRHAEPNGPGRRRESPHPGQRVLHAQGGRGCALLVALAAAEQQDGIPAELQEVGVVRVRCADQLGKGSVENAGDLLRAFAPAFRELLGELGEARDIGEDERALERLGLGFGRVAQPVRRDPRHERLQRIDRRARSCSRCPAHRFASLTGGAR